MEKECCHKYFKFRHKVKVCSLCGHSKLKGNTDGTIDISYKNYDFSEIIKDRKLYVNFKMTKHCKKRMEQRKIGMNQIKDSILMGFKNLLGGGWRVSYKHDDILVIIDPFLKNIITCYKIVN